MLRRTFFTGALGLVLLAGTVIGSTRQYQSAQARFDVATSTASYPGCQSVIVGGRITLPAEHLLLPLVKGQSARMISAVDNGPTELLGVVTGSDPFADETTSLDASSSAQAVRTTIGLEPVYVAGEVRIANKRYAEIFFFPMTVDHQGQLLFHPDVTLSLGGNEILSTACAKFDDLASREAIASSLSSTDQSAVDYVVITTQQLADAFAPLVRYKNETGYHAAIELIEDITSAYSGIDNAEKLRNYLKDYYAAGGKYVLLGGDETIVPIRYAYNLSADTMPSLADQLVCDLYFADLTGDWDLDHDGVYGERYGDAADIAPELMVGRLPFHSAAKITAYTDKLIRYETNPGNGDLSYLTKAFFFASDQMRDWTPMSQQSRMARAFPARFTVDTTDGVEHSAGNDLAPTNQTPRQLRPLLSSGFGIINVIAHGRSDGFAVRTAGYNTYPKLCILAAAQSGDADCFDSMQSVNRPAFYYSLGCDNGAFDKDQPPFNVPGESFAENVLGETDGAVAMVANSRWGWVSSSYLLQTSFYDSLFAHPERPAVAAMNSSKAVYSYYRDLVYGQIFFGDPSIRVYTQTPVQPVLTTSGTTSGVRIEVRAGQNPVAGCAVTVSQDGTPVAGGTTDNAGVCVIDLSGSTRSFAITAHGAGMLTTRGTFSSSIVTGVDDRANKPGRFELAQNYPNPFNPATRITYSIPSATAVHLEIYDLLGTLVTILVNQKMSAGTHEIEWNGQDSRGGTVASGVYFYRLSANGQIAAKKMILLK